MRSCLDVAPPPPAKSRLRLRRGQGRMAAIPGPQAGNERSMDFELTESQEAIRTQARALAARFDDGYWRRCDAAHEFPWEFYQAFAEAGWLGIAIPPEYGGAGLGITEASLLLEEVAASGAAMNGA